MLCRVKARASLTGSRLLHFRTLTVGLHFGPMQTADFDFLLPAELIAQHPCPKRDQSRLLVLHRASGQVCHAVFSDLPNYLEPGDVVVLNNSKVIPARLAGINARTGGAFEVLLLEDNAVNDWWALVRPGKRARLGTRISIQDRSGRTSGIEATVADRGDGQRQRLHFEGTPDIGKVLDRLGRVPLPPYITRNGTEDGQEDQERYQTVFAAVPGSVAAPTAGLHFTDALIERLHAKGIGTCFITLHVGLGTFAPVRVRDLAQHVMHEERFELGSATVAAIASARAAGRRVVAVGTTTLRVLESVAAAHGGRLVAGCGRTRLFVYPPYQFQVVDALVTNFHLPCSTLLMLACAFASPGHTRGRDVLLGAYAEAIRLRYRFFSYGDAMLIL